MAVHLEPGAAEACIAACDAFVSEVGKPSLIGQKLTQSFSPDAFDTARQIGTVYELLAGTDLQSLLNGYVDQVKAMARVFEAAGGVIEAQDEQVASALAKAAEEPPGMASLGLMGSLAPMADYAELTAPGAYQRVGHEEVSGTPLERLVSAAQALEPTQYTGISAQVGSVAATLGEAAGNLKSQLGRVLDEQWQGEFTQGAQSAVGGITESALELARSLEKASSRALRLEGGYSTTRSRISEYADVLSEDRVSTGGGVAGGIGVIQAEREATEQARAIVNTEYSPAVMDANLDDLDFPTAYKVVSAAGLGGPGGIDFGTIWNDDGVIRPANAVAPPESAIAAAGGGAGSGATGGVAGGAGGGATTTSSPAPTDAATEQALLASRNGAVDGSGAGAAAGGPGAGGTGAGVTGAGAGTGLNTATTAAATPLATGATANQQRTSAGSGIIGRGARSGSGSNNRDRNNSGFGNAAGLLGGGGAAAGGAGAAAARMGGAGTLAGLGGAAGGVSGAPGTGSAPAGAFSSSSPTTGAAAGTRPGMMPMGMMGGAAGTQGGRRDGHTHASYLVNATNTTEIIGEPPKASPAIIGRRPTLEAETAEASLPESRSEFRPGDGRSITR